MDKKSFPLRISPALFDEIKRWADQEMRSVNGQIEYLLREAVRQRMKKNVPELTDLSEERGGSSSAPDAS